MTTQRAWAADPALRPWEQGHPSPEPSTAHRSSVHDAGPGEAPGDAAAFGGTPTAAAGNWPGTGTSKSWASNPSLTPWSDASVRAPEPEEAPAAPATAIPEVIPLAHDDRVGRGAQRPDKHGVDEHASTGTIGAPPWVSSGDGAAPVVGSPEPLQHPSSLAGSASTFLPPSPAPGPAEESSLVSALWVPTARRRRPPPEPESTFDGADTRTAGGAAHRGGRNSALAQPAAVAPKAPSPIPPHNTQLRPAPPRSVRPRNALADTPTGAVSVPHAGGGRPRPEQVTTRTPGPEVVSTASVARAVVPADPGRVVAAVVEPLTEEGIVRRRGEGSGTGWRRALFVASGGAVRVPAGVAQRRRDEWISRIRTDLPTWHTVTVASIKGGIGKTTLAALVGLALAEYRGDRVVALDANPDAGTLADRLLGGPALRTVRDLITELDSVETSTEMARYTAVAHRLHVLASDQDPAMSEAFSKGEYDLVLRLLKRFYNIIITDSGTGLIHSAMGGALESTRTLVIAGAPTVDGGSRASKTLDWLHAHGFDELAADAVVVLSQDRSSREVDREAIAEHFRRRCRAVVDLPLDPHLMTGGQIVFDRLRSRTRDAALEIAAHVGDQFGWDWPEQHTVPTRGLQHAAPRHPDEG